MQSVKNQYVFFFPWGDGDSVIIRDSVFIYQLTHVLRIQQGDFLVLLNGQGEKLLVKTVEISRYQIICQKLQKEWKAQEKPFWHLVVGTPKKEALKEILRYGTQLGVSSFILFDAEYSQWKAIQYEAKRETYEAIIKESLEQSGRVYLPSFQTFSSWEDLKSNKIGLHPIWIADLQEEESSQELQSLIDYNYQEYSDIYLVIGPEGGWSSTERENFRMHSGYFYTLSPYILRLQTAAIMSVVVAQTILNVQNRGESSAALAPQNLDYEWPKEE